jgi:hypothetical protein
MLSFSKAFNSLSLCFVYMVLFLQTILDVYNISYFYIVSLYRNDPTPRKIDRWLVLKVYRIGIG